MDVDERTETVHERLEEDVDVDQDRIRRELEALDEYDVPGEQAEESVLRKLADEEDMEVGELVDGSGSGDGEMPEVDVDEINQDGQWVTVRGQVADLWDNDTDSISQVGLFSDGTGRVRFVAWEKSQVPLLAEGQSYELQGVATEEYEGQYSISLNSQTEVEQVTEEFEDTQTFEGALVALQSGSGLIHRNSETDQYVPNENDEDGETYLDLRIKGVLDDGDTVQEVIFDRELTEELTGITLDEAKDMAQQAMDKEVVADEMRPQLLGRLYHVEGTDLGRYFLVEDYEQMVETPEVDSLLVKARSM